MAKRARNIVYFDVNFNVPKTAVGLSNSTLIINAYSKLMLAGSKLVPEIEDHLIYPVFTDVAGREQIRVSFSVQFKVYPRDHDWTGTSKAYPYAALHLQLVSLCNITELFRENVIDLRYRVDTSRMIPPWVVPVGNGLILRNGYATWVVPENLMCDKYISENSIDGPQRPSIYRNINALIAEKMTVVGEPRAVDKFKRLWAFLYQQGKCKEFNLLSIINSHRQLNWQNIRIMMSRADNDGKVIHEVLKDIDMVQSLEYYKRFGNTLLTTPLHGDSAAFFKDCFYYEMEHTLI